MTSDNPTKTVIVLRSISEATCDHCGHRIAQHMAESEHPDLPGMMPCEVAGCECVDFHCLAPNGVPS